MANFVDDELNDLPVKNAVTKAEAKTAAATAVLDDDDSVDLIGDHDQLKAQAVLPNVLPKEQGKTTRFALVKGQKAFAKETHFLAGAGNGKGLTIQCPGQNCPECAKGGDHRSRRKVVALCVKYETDAQGKFPAGTTKPSLSIGFVNLSPTAYTEMSECPSEGETIFDLDFKATRKSNNIGWNFNRMTAPPAYLKAGMEAEVAELAKEYADGKVLKSRLGKVVTLAELKVMIAGAGAGVAEATLEGIEDLD